MNDKLIKTVSDTGSLVIVISEALMKELKLKVTGFSNLKVQTIANEKLKLLEKLAMLP